MRRSTAAFIQLVIIIPIMACGEPSSLMSEMPEGYSVYMTYNPKNANLKETLAEVEDNLPEEAMDDIRSSGLRFNPLSWDAWEDELGLDYSSDIGVVTNLPGDERMTAFYLPTEDIQAVERFLDENESENYKLIDHGSYTVVFSGDEDAMGNFERTFENHSVSRLRDYEQLAGTINIRDPGFSLYMRIEQEVSLSYLLEIGNDGNQSVTEVAVMLRDELSIPAIFESFSNGVVHEDILVPENTIGAARFGFVHDQLADNWRSIEHRFNLEDNREYQSFNQGLTVLGLPSLTDLIEILGGDIFFALADIEFDDHGDLKNLEGVIAISLADVEGMKDILRSIAMLADFKCDRIDQTELYSFEDRHNEYSLFICNSALYIAVNTSPESITGGIPMEDVFMGDVAGIAAEGFLGASMDPEILLRKLDVPSGIMDAFEEIFDQPVEISIAYDNGMFHGTLRSGKFLGGVGAEALIFAMTFPKYSSDVQDHQMEEVTCRCNMRSLASGESMFYGMENRYGTLEELALSDIMENAPELICPTCPTCGEDYIVTLNNGSYRIECPCGLHGSVEDGLFSWQ